MKIKRLFYAFLFLFAFGVLVSCTNNVYKLNVVFDSTCGNVTYTKANSGDGYKENTDITITVNPTNNYEVGKVMVNKDEVELTENSYSFKITKDTEVLVEFNKKVEPVKAYSVNVSLNNDNYAEYELITESTNVTSDKLYIEGSTVELKVTAKEACEIVEVKVDGTTVQLENGSYSFEVNSNVEVNIVAKLMDVVNYLPETALAAMQSSFELDGVYRLYYALDKETEVYNSVKTIFDETSVYQLEVDLLTDEVLYLIQIVNHNGLCATPSISLKNVVTLTDSEDKFDDFDNPFKDLVVTDFVEVADGKYELINKKDEVATCISGWNETIDKFYVYVENGLIVTIEFNTVEISLDDGESYHSNYSFDVSGYGESTTNIRTTPYETVPEHAILAAALEKAGNNYTVNHRDIWEGEDDIVYNVYVDERGTHSDYDEDGKTHGYVQIERYVYEFYYDGTTVTVGDAISGVESIADFQADFTVFAPELFDFVGNGTYVAKDSSIAAAVVSWIGEEYDTQRLGQYATSLKIILKDEVLYQVEFDYLVYGYVGKAILTYSDFGTTKIDIDFSNVVQVSVLDEYIGVWTNSNHKIEITKEGIKIDGVEYVVLEYEDGIFYGTLNDVEFYLAKWTDNELVVYDENGQLSYIVGLEQEYVKVVIPENYKGVWANEEHKIIVQTNVVIIDGVEFVLTGYSEETGLKGKYQGDLYYLVLVDDEESTELYFTTSDFSDFYSVTKTNESYIEIPESYIGTWKDNDEKMVVEITFMGITINGLPYEIKSYNEFYGFTGTYNGTAEYMVAPYYSNDKLQVGTMESNYICTKVQNGGEQPNKVTVQPEHVGKYVGTDEETNVVYEIVITETTITVNGKELVLTSYDEYEGYSGTIDGESYALMYITYDGEPKMYFMNDDYTLFVQCPVVKASTVTIPEDQYGTYVGEKNNVKYEVVISEGSIKINGVAFIPTSYDEYEGYSGTLNGEAYTVVYMGPWGDLPAQVQIFNSDYTLSVLCDIVNGGTVEPPVTVTIPEDQYGTYVGEKNNVKYEVVISEGSITINGVAFIPTLYDEYEGYSGTLNGEAYTVVYMGPWGDLPAQVRFMNSDYTLVVLCDIVSNTTEK